MREGRRDVLFVLFGLFFLVGLALEMMLMIMITTMMVPTMMMIKIMSGERECVINERGGKTINPYL